MSTEQLIETLRARAKFHSGWTGNFSVNLPTHWRGVADQSHQSRSCTISRIRKSNFYPGSVKN